MRVFVAGASGSIGRAVVQALRWRGHRVFEGVRRTDAAGERSAAIPTDLMQARSPDAWAALLGPLDVDAVVNAVGILMPSPGATFTRVHAEGPIELFEGARRAGVRRVVQVSALGVGATGDVDGDREPAYLASKRRADEWLLACGALDAAVVRPSLVVGPRSESTRLFATLAALPVIGLPGRGAQPLQPLHVLELAEAIVALVESSGSARGVYELGGSAVVSYREMLAAYRRAQGLGAAIWLPVPMRLMVLGARLAELFPQRVASRDTILLLARGNTTRRNALPVLLGRAPSSLAEALVVEQPRPLLDVRVSIAPAVDASLRAALAFLWLQTAFVSALLPNASGVLDLLARCGFSGQAGVAMWLASCTLNASFGVATLLRPDVRVYALQAAAVIGYTAVAAWHVPALTIDHCAPLAKNVPLLALVVALWLAAASRPAPAHADRPGRGGQTSMLATRRALPSMKFRRGSTSSPISIVKTRSASIASSS